MNDIIIISGATATGKTKISIELAKITQGVVVNFDSLLFYKEINIGTAKPTQEEMNGVPHYLVGTESISSPLNAADFVRKALPIINAIHQDNKTVFLVGGSGFYLRALVEGMYESATTPQEITDRSNDLYKKDGIDPFIDILKNLDPEILRSLHPNDHYRLRRAVEHIWTSGCKFSETKKRMEIEKEHRTKNIHNWNILHTYLLIPKNEHWKIMEDRTRQMIKMGLIDEVKQLRKQGFTGCESPLQSIGYKETLAFLDGKIPSEEELIERIYLNTRRLAKSQKTWFNGISDKKTYNPISDFDNLVSDVRAWLKK